MADRYPIVLVNGQLKELPSGDTIPFVSVLVPNQSANTVYSGPASGGAAAPGFRALVLADVASSVLGTGTANSTTYLRGDRTWQTISTGLTVGTTPIASGNASRVLFHSASGDYVDESANLKFDGTNLVLGNGTKHLEIGLDSSYNAVFGHAYAVSDNVAQYQFKYFKTGGYGAHGLALVDTGFGYTTVLNQLASGTLYWTDGSGSPGVLAVGAWNNPNDGNNLRARFGAWDMPTGDAFAVNAAWQGNAFLEVTGTTEQVRTSYDASNYESTTVSSTGVVTRNAVGSFSGAGFVFSDAVEVAYDSTHYGSHTVNSSSEYTIEAIGPSTTGEVKLKAGSNYIAVNASGASDTATIQAPYINIGASGLSQIIIGDSSSDMLLESNVIQMNNLPTSDPGVPGQLWNDGGKLMISI